MAALFSSMALSRGPVLTSTRESISSAALAGGHLKPAALGAARLTTWPATSGSRGTVRFCGNPTVGLVLALPDGGFAIPTVMACCCMISSRRRGLSQRPPTRYPRNFFNLFRVRLDAVRGAPGGWVYRARVARIRSPRRGGPRGGGPQAPRWPAQSAAWRCAQAAHAAAARLRHIPSALAWTPACVACDSPFAHRDFFSTRTRGPPIKPIKASECRL